MAISINSAADARYYASRVNSSKNSSSSAAKKSTSSIVSSAARAVASATSAVKSVVKKNSSSATTTTKRNNTNAAVNAASVSVKSKTNQNKKTTTTISSAASKVASSISKAVKTATNAVKTAAQNTKVSINAKAAAASTTKTTSKNTTSSKNTTNSKTAAVNNSNTKKTTSSNNNNLASRIVNTVSTAASTVKKAASNANPSAAAEIARQEAMSKAESARAEAEAKARATTATKSATASAAIGVATTATIKSNKNTALSNKNTGKTTNTTVNPNVVKMDSTTKNNVPDKYVVETKYVQTTYTKNNPPKNESFESSTSRISDKDRINNAVSILAAKNARIPVDSHGVPIINNGGDAKRYMEELNKIKDKENQIKIAAEAGIAVDSNGNPVFRTDDFKTMPFSSSYVAINNEDHQKMLMALGAYAPQDIKRYTENQGITLDGYTLIGLCIGESTGGQTSNYFGAVEGLSQKSKDLAEVLAINALITSGVASDEKEAKNIMENDDFYFQAGCVISYLNNTMNNEGLVTNCYTSLTETMVNDINAWRNGERNGENSTSGYEDRFTYRGN